ncbi:MAG: segregation/condensation protein A [Spirochaetota bacterium]
MSENVITGEAVFENENSYVVSIDQFNGPFDVLWDLIKKSKIDITELSISEITEQYIAFLKKLEAMDVKLASDFILMASELLYYKSRALLPSGDVEDEYFTKPLPPELIQKLIEYKKFQKVSDELRNYFDKQNNVFLRENIPGELGEEEYYYDVSLYELLKAFSAVLNSATVVESREILFDEILVSDKIDSIIQLLKEKESLLFDDIFTSKPSRAEVIASFLALLEMTKSGIIKIQQHRVFGDIRILRNFNLEQIQQINQ